MRQLAPIALPPPIRFVHPITTPRLIMDTVTFANDTRTVGVHQVGTAPRLGCYTTSSHPIMACTSSTVFASKNAPFFSSGFTLAASKLDSLETGIGYIIFINGFIVDVHLVNS